MPTLTIFTPTYNRAELLKQLYGHLASQTSKDFVWLIVDDGSKDNTEEVVKSFENSSFNIRYIKQENGGKHTAFNRAIDECDTEIFICVDSDDYIVDNAVERIIFNYQSIKDDEKISGIAGICQDKQGNMLGGYFPENGLISDTMEIRDKYGLPGEPEIYKTDILKKYRFEVFDGERFLTEAILFDKLTSKYKLKYINEVWMVKEYLQGGLTDNQLKIRIDCINGSKTYYKQRLNLSKKNKAKVKAAINYSRFCIHGGNIKECFKSGNGLLSTITFPVAVAMVAKDKKEMKDKYK